MNIVMASGDLPDIIHMQSMDSNFKKYASDGMLLPLNEYLATSPNIQNRLGDATSTFYATTILPEDGQIYAVPRSHEASYYIGLYRKDWFDQAGIDKVPETPEELLEAGKKIKATFDKPLFSLVPEEEALQQFQDAFGIHHLLDIEKEAGKVVITEGQAGYLKLMDFYREAYELGILESEWYLNKSYDDGEKFKQDKLGLLLQWKKPIELYGEVAQNLKETFPESELGTMLPLKNEGGTSYLAIEPSIWGGFAVSADTKHPDRVMEFIDWAHSDEGITLTAAGIPGVTYESYDINTHICEYTEDQQDARNEYLSGFMQFITAENGVRFVTPGNTPEERDTVNGILNDFVSSTELYTITPISSVPGFSESRAPLVDIISEKNTMVAKYITGEVSREDFVSFIENEFLPANAASIQILQEYADANKDSLKVSAK